MFAATDVPGAWLRGYAYEAGTKRLGYVTRPVHCIALQQLISAVDAWGGRCE